MSTFFFFQAEDGIRDVAVTGVQTCALPILTVAEYFGYLTPYLVYNLAPLAGLVAGVVTLGIMRSGEGRVGEEGRSRGGADHLKKKKKNLGDARCWDDDVSDKDESVVSTVT